MPKATVDTTSTQRFELETCPGAFVELRHMSYGEYLKRRDMVSKMGFKGEGKNTEAFMEMANEVVALFEFQACIVDHNLEDDNGTKLEFAGNKGKMTFKTLHPRIGEEISSYIDKMNKWDEGGEDPLPSSQE